MGLFETIRKSRAKTKAEIAAAKKRAKQEPRKRPSCSTSATSC